MFLKYQAERHREQISVSKRQRMGEMGEGSQKVKKKKKKKFNTKNLCETIAWWSILMDTLTYNIKEEKKKIKYF